jgi:hypothetical protein
MPYVSVQQGSLNMRATRCAVAEIVVEPNDFHVGIFRRLTALSRPCSDLHAALAGSANPLAIRANLVAGQALETSAYKSTTWAALMTTRLPSFRTASTVLRSPKLPPDTRLFHVAVRARK